MAKWKYISGYCLHGQHEGNKPKNYQGQPLPTCQLESTQCRCDCHKLIDKMFKDVNLPRVTQPNPEYNPDKQDFFIPSVLDNVRTHAPFISDRVDTPTSSSDGPEPGANVPHMAPSRARTATGRRFRGGLEYEVLKVCLEYAADVYEWEHCTPKAIADRIRRTTLHEEPSTGAIGAVFDRWVRIGFAECQKKPVRFVKFLVEDSSWEGLERLKLEQKTSRRKQKAQQKRGYR